MALNRAVITTYKVPLQTVGKGDVQQHLSNPDTMSILVSDTLVSHALRSESLVISPKEV